MSCVRLRLLPRPSYEASLLVILSSPHVGDVFKNRHFIPVRGQQGILFPT